MSHKQLTPNDKYTVNKLIDSGMVKAEIAKILDFHPASIGKKVKRNTDPTFKGVYKFTVGCPIRGFSLKNEFLLIQNP